MSDFAIKIGDLSDPREVDRLVMAVAQNICCPDGCETGGLGCRAGSKRDEAVRRLAAAPIVLGDDQ